MDVLINKSNLDPTPQSRSFMIQLSKSIFCQCLSANSRTTRPLILGISIISTTHPISPVHQLPDSQARMVLTRQIGGILRDGFGMGPPSVNYLRDLIEVISWPFVFWCTIVELASWKVGPWKLGYVIHHRLR
jgi:hypothetical protein